MIASKHNSINEAMGLRLGDEPFVRTAWRGGYGGLTVSCCYLAKNCAQQSSVVIKSAGSGGETFANNIASLRRSL